MDSRTCCGTGESNIEVGRKMEEKQARGDDGDPLIDGHDRSGESVQGAAFIA
jgi:hypothetical protein